MARSSSSSRRSSSSSSPSRRPKRRIKRRRRRRRERSSSSSSRSRSRSKSRTRSSESRGKEPAPQPAADQEIAPGYPGYHPGYYPPGYDPFFGPPPPGVDPHAFAMHQHAAAHHHAAMHHQAAMHHHAAMQHQQAVYHQQMQQLQGRKTEAQRRREDRKADEALLPPLDAAQIEEITAKIRECGGEIDGGALMGTMLRKCKKCQLVPHFDIIVRGGNGKFFVRLKGTAADPLPNLKIMDQDRSRSRSPRRRRSRRGGRDRVEDLPPLDEETIHAIRRRIQDCGGSVDGGVLTGFVMRKVKRIQLESHFDIENVEGGKFIVRLRGSGSSPRFQTPPLQTHPSATTAIADGNDLSTGASVVAGASDADAAPRACATAGSGSATTAVAAPEKEGESAKNGCIVDTTTSNNSDAPAAASKGSEPQEQRYDLKIDMDEL